MQTQSSVFDDLARLMTGAMGMAQGAREEAKGFYQKLVESYPRGEWSTKAKDRLLEMGTRGVALELDS